MAPPFQALGPQYSTDPYQVFSCIYRKITQIYVVNFTNTPCKYPHSHVTHTFVAMSCLSQPPGITVDPPFSRASESPVNQMFLH